MFNSIKKKLAQRAVYRQTVRELKSLTNRELADLGVNRYEIESLAKQHSYQTFI